MQLNPTKIAPKLVEICRGVWVGVGARACVRVCACLGGVGVCGGEGALGVAGMGVVGVGAGGSVVRVLTIFQ